MRVMLRTVHHLNPLGGKIDSLHFSVEEIHLSKEFPDRIDYMRDVHVARRNLMQHGRKKEEVFAVYESCFDVRQARQYAFKFQRRVKPAESCSQDHDSVPKSVAHAALSPMLRDRVSLRCGRLLKRRRSTTTKTKRNNRPSETSLKSWPQLALSARKLGFCIRQ